jgi:hypothetical protein
MKKDLTEEQLEEFIRKNKDKFSEYKINDDHEIKFMTRLQLKVKHYINITPHLVKVAIITVIIFITSSLIWYNFMRKDKTKPVYENIVDQFKKDKSKK